MTYLAFLKNFNVPLTPKAEADPLYTQEEFQTAQERAFSEGVDKGRKETSTGLENQIISIIQGFRIQVEDLYKQQTQSLEQIYRDAQEIALCIATKHAQTEAEKNALERCCQFVQTALRSVLEKTALSIRVHPQIGQDLKDRLKDMDIYIQEDESLELASASLSWSNGGAYTAFKDVQKNIDTLMKEWMRGDTLLDLKNLDKQTTKGDYNND